MLVVTAKKLQVHVNGDIRRKKRRKKVNLDLSFDSRQTKVE